MSQRLLSLTRRLALAGAMTLALTWALVILATPSASAAGRAKLDSGMMGIVSGVLTNGSTGAPLANQPVTLQLNVSSSVKNLATIKTASNGSFNFANVDASPASLGAVWAVFTSYQNGTYASGALDVAAGKTVDGSFRAYDATQDSSNLKVSSAIILISSVDAQHGLVSVGEILTFTNGGKTAFVGLAPTGNSATMPPLLRFAVPPNAINLAPGAGFYGTQILQVDTGFAATATVPPGTSEFAFSFQMPYTGMTLNIPFKAEYPVAQVESLVPPNMLARDATGFTAQGIVTSFGAQYQVYSATNLAASEQATLSLYELPKAGQQSYLNATALVWLAAIIALILALFAGFYVWRGAFLTAPTASVVSGAGQAEADHKRTLQQALDLERRHARGQISEAEFKRQNTAVRQLLRAQLAAASRPAAAVTSSTTASAASEPESEPAPETPATVTPSEASKGGAR